MHAATHDIRPDQLEDILKGITIPSPPQVLADLQIELAMPDPDLRAMADRISTDVGLAGSVLKAVNSPLFGLRQPVASVQHAVNLLGIATVVSLVDAYYIRNEFLNRRLGREALAIMTRFWDSAIDVANCAALIARQVLYQAPEKAYLLGLFHNAAIPLLQQRFPNYPSVQVAAYQDPDGQITRTENDTLHTSHQVMSYYVANAWKLPPEICTVIRNHHNLERLTNPADAEIHTLAALLKLAEHVVGLHRILGDQAVDHEWERIGEQVMSTLGVDASDVEDIASLAQEKGIGNQAYYM